jgi:hypothetical protein
MRTFNYFQLIAFFYSGIFDLIKQGSNFEMATNRTLDDFWHYPENENRLSNLVILIQNAHIKYAMYKTFTARQIEVYKHQLELIKDDDLTLCLCPDELEHFNETVYNLNAEIDDFLQRINQSK